MTSKEFFNRISNSSIDFLQEFVDLLRQKSISFCIIGGLGVNAYTTEPIVTLDCDFVIKSSEIDKLLPEIKKRYKIKKFERSINVYSDKSDMRIQIQTDQRLQPCLENTKEKNILGYKLPVATIENVFRSKIIAAMAPDRRESKRRKDHADILRLIEVKKELIKLLPDKLKKILDMDSNKTNTKVPEL